MTEKIEDWFDVNNIEHLKAYKHLMGNGYWEEGFIPENVTVEPMSTIGIMNKLSEAYITKMLKE